MKSFVTTGAIMALLSSTSLMAANLTIPMSFEYLALDGKQIETNMFSHKSDLSLDNGSHKIAIRYHDMVEDDFSDSQSFIKSAPFIVTLNVDADVNYTLSAADGDVVKRPKSFAKDPKIIITREDKGAVNYTVEQTNFEEKSFLTNIFSGNKGDNVDVLAVNATGSSAAPAAAVQSAKPAVSATVAATAVATSEANTAQPIKADNPAQAEQMLQYWWLQADEKTRKEFMGWAIKQL